MFKILYRSLMGSMKPSATPFKALRSSCFSNPTSAPDLLFRTESSAILSTVLGHKLVALFFPKPTVFSVLGAFRIVLGVRADLDRLFLGISLASKAFVNTTSLREQFIVEIGLACSCSY